LALGRSGQGRGEAFFVAAPKRSGSAALYHILKVHRNGVGGAHKFDKELMRMLADCGSRKVLMIDHRHQLGNAVMPPMFTYVVPPGPPEPGSVEDSALKAVCGDDLQAVPIVERPYPWAKARLREGGMKR
jgi:hypothetical protein